MEFCIYPRAGWNNDHPSAIYRLDYLHMDHFWYNRHNQYGAHRVFDNSGKPQFGLYVTLNNKYNGAGVYFWIYEGRSVDVNLTPTDSVTLWLDRQPTT